MDFYTIKENYSKNGVEIYPDFKVCRSKDLMIRGKAFYAVWDDEAGLWSTDEYDVQRIVDKDLKEYYEQLKKRTSDTIKVRWLSNFSSNSWKYFKMYCTQLSDNSHQLDENLTFANDEVTKKDYVSKRLPYPLEKGDYKAYDEIIGTLYEPEERAKLEWGIGAVICGDARRLQKFIVLYGEAGAGKSTILNIIQQLFEGYYTTFDAKALTGSNNAFSTEVFRSNPLVAIQHDGDLSHIEDNTKLNSIVSHEEMSMNEKYKASYTARINAFLFMATNRPVKITDAKSGIIRRLIDVRPSGNRIPSKRYQELMGRVKFELGAIAYHCREVYYEMGRDYYNNYIPFNMIFQTDVFFNYVEDNFELFKQQDGVSLKQAYSIYKEYCDDTLVQFKLPMYKFREELKNYFDKFEEVARVDGKQIRSYYSGFKKDKFSISTVESEEDRTGWLVFNKTESLLDEMYADSPAQYANEAGTPSVKWSNVKTELKDIDTKKLHYLKPDENNLIVIDFDLKNEEGEKDFERNLIAAMKWPPTYAELSKGGQGIHLHYIYDGKVEELSHIFDDNVEIKIFSGNSSLRRRVSKCNDIPVAHISSGLPRKGAKKVINFEAVTNEKAIRTMIDKNLRKEYHNATAPSVSFIYKILDDAYNSGANYDVTDLRPAILNFAVNSTNQSENCIKLVNKMKFKSENASESKGNEEAPIVFFDVEVFPNLFLVNWKYAGDDKKCVRMINPTPSDIETLLKMRLIGFNCRRYDNHILYGRYIGYTNEQLYNLSQRIINGSRNAFFSEAYNLSYTDIYDFSSKKQSLKKFEIDLGIHHQELDLPWDQPVPEELWDKVAEYCDNDVVATEAVFNDRQADWTARQILSKLSGLCENETTQHHAAKIIFGDDPKPQDKFVYTDLSEMFPGYKFENGKSIYRGEEVGEGGYVYAEPGMYFNVPILDVASMHPTSIEQLNLFGPYTKNFSDIKSSRIAIKHENRETLKNILEGKLIPFYDAALKVNATFTLDDLSYAMKIVINIVYGLTTAKFNNPFKDPRNVDNIVAKRGALFMIDLKHAVQEKGFKVAHIKTDSIKIPNATDEIIEFVKEFGKKYGYEFEHEATYDRMCLVNNAVYISKYDDKGIRNKGGKHANEWSATGAQFQHPYIFKTLFSKEPVAFKDMCEAKSVQTEMYLDFNEDLPEDEHHYQFVGKTGLFCPVKSGCGGGLLLRKKDEKYDAVTGTKGYRWKESETLEKLGKDDEVDKQYYANLINTAIDTISKFGDYEQFVSREKFINSPLYICDYQNVLGDCDNCPKKNTCDISNSEELPFD